MAKKRVTPEKPADRATPAKKTTRKKRAAPKRPAATREEPEMPDNDPANVPREPQESPYKKLETYQFLFVLVAILVSIAWVGLRAQEENRVFSWLIILLLMTAFAVVLGRAVTKNWRGILIDRRNRMSLSRLQVLAWTIVILSAIFTAALTNVAYGWESPLNIDIPSQLWVVMGISTASVVSSSAILGNKAKKEVTEEIQKKMGTDSVGLVACNDYPRDARWSDLMMGEEVGNFSHVDIGKMQMFFFTFILVIGYGAALGAMFREPGVVTGLPGVEDGMNVLLGISHTGYLANKTITHTPEAETGTKPT